MRRADPKVLSKTATMYMQGKSIREIAEYMGVTFQAIALRLKRAGVKARKRGRVPQAA